MENIICYTSICMMAFDKYDMESYIPILLNEKLTEIGCENMVYNIFRTKRKLPHRNGNDKEFSTIISITFNHNAFDEDVFINKLVSECNVLTKKDVDLEYIQ